ncbi:hypothetical protein [Alkalihalobacterium chitinilyticum]|uniref:DUF1499 domain-containing protein n=1 Tax=Alkalihalobacterium chitinilyticum TaxID=2980103 RepID=A0ABT5VEX1_9BACI|nr:hypothetical protein [Alkalihalobacterium chitinilyticum]MDE5412754.1 hypothetical protein [Alkalihalobacterium chitinilyticum]
MSVMRTITGIWKSSEETSEQPKVPELKTRYFSKNQRAMIEHVTTTINQKFSDWEIKKVDLERGEIIVEKKKGTPYLMIITVFKIDPVKSAIDILCSKQGSLGDLGQSYRYIQQFFNQI